MSNYSYYY